MNDANLTNMPKYKTIFSLRVRKELRDRGIEPLVEMENTNHPGYKCWRYEITDEFNEAMDVIMKGGQDYGK